MSLRIRRGTDAQRQTALLDQGELAYTTDTQKLYIGNGSTVGGVNILSTAAGIGLVFDQLTQTLKLSGSTTIVQSDTAPRLGGNLNLNTHNITGTGNITTIGTISNGSFSLDRTGNITNVGNIASTGTISTGGVSLDRNGNITNSGTIRSTGGISTTGSISNDAFYFDSVGSLIPQAGSNGITIYGKDGRLVRFIGLGGAGIADASIIGIRSSRGTVDEPTAMEPGDYLTGLVFAAYTQDGYNDSGGLFVSLDSTADLNSASPASNLQIILGTNGNDYTNYSFDTSGVFTSPIISTTSYSVADIPLPSAVISGAGARAFVSDATLASFGAEYTGGGIYQAPVYSDGTIWRIG